VTIGIIAAMGCLKKEYEEISTGNYQSVVRDVNYVKRISADEFDRQKKDYTEREVNKLLKSPLYKKKISQISAEKENQFDKSYNYSY
jgi:hypothetical protein